MESATINPTILLKVAACIENLKYTTRATSCDGNITRSPQVLQDHGFSFYIESNSASEILVNLNILILSCREMNTETDEFGPLPLIGMNNYKIISKIPKSGIIK